MPFLDKLEPMNITVEDTKQYSLTITLGAGIRQGRNSFKFMGKTVAGTSIIDSPLGSGLAIRGKSLIVKSIFSADNPATPFVVVNYVVSHNKPDFRGDAVDKDLFYTFHLKINFI